MLFCPLRFFGLIFISIGVVFILGMLFNFFAGLLLFDILLFAPAFIIGWIKECRENPGLDADFFRAAGMPTSEDIINSFEGSMGKEVADKLRKSCKKMYPSPNKKAGNGASCFYE